MCSEAVYLVARELIRQDEIYAAIWVILQFDICGREQDVECLFPADIVQSGGEYALVFGVSARGETVKTGRDQGAVIEQPWVGRLVMALAERTPVGARIFPLTQEGFRRRWAAALTSLGLPFRPPHALRHTAAAEAIFQKRLSLEQVRRRGRWKALSSVQRYTKTHDIVNYKGSMDPQLLAEGEQLLKDLPKHFQTELGSRPGELSAALACAVGGEVQTSTTCTTADGEGGNLVKRTVAELRAMCRSKNLAVTGKKADLIERLRGHNVADGDDSCEDGWEGR